MAELKAKQAPLPPLTSTTSPKEEWEDPAKTQLHRDTVGKKLFGQEKLKQEKRFGQEKLKQEIHNQKVKAKAEAEAKAATEKEEEEARLRRAIQIEMWRQEAMANEQFLLEVGIKKIAQLYGSSVITIIRSPRKSVGPAPLPTSVAGLVALADSLPRSPFAGVYAFLLALLVRTRATCASVTPR